MYRLASICILHSAEYAAADSQSAVVHMTALS